MSRTRPLEALVHRVLAHRLQSASTSILVRHDGPLMNALVGLDLIGELEKQLYRSGKDPVIFELIETEMHSWGALRLIEQAARQTERAIALVIVHGAEKVAPFAAELDDKLVSQGDLLLHFSLYRLLRIKKAIVIFTADMNTRLSAFALEQMAFAIRDSEIREDEVTSTASSALLESSTAPSSMLPSAGLIFPAPQPSSLPSQPS